MIRACSDSSAVRLRPHRRPIRSRMIDSLAATRPIARSIPDCAPRASGMLALDARHTMYWEECGNPDGVPLLFIHGGPGGGSLPHHRRFYDPSFWRIVLYDQRGAGRSTPAAELADNTTAHLVDDIERLRDAPRHRALAAVRRLVGIDARAAVRARRIPSACSGLVLRGIFLATRAEIDWFMHGMRAHLPGSVARVHALPAAGRARRRARQLLSPADRSRSARPRARRAGVGPLRERVLDAAAEAGRQRPPRRRRRRARDRAHRGALLRARLRSSSPTTVLAHVPRIRHLPCTIVQGRYDIICPPVAADALARAWPEAEYIVVPDAGHSVREPGIDARARRRRAADAGGDAVTRTRERRTMTTRTRSGRRAAARPSGIRARR